MAGQDVDFRRRALWPQSIFSAPRILQAIENGVDPDHIPFNPVIDGERESLRQHAVITAKVHGM